MDYAALLVGAGIALGSAFLGVVSDAVKSWMTRRTTLSDKRTAFQHRTALELQEALHELTRGVTVMYEANLSAYYKTEKWGVGAIPDGIGESDRLNRIRAVMLSERLDDDNVRAVVRSLITSGLQTFSAHTATEAGEQMDDLYAKSEAANKALGKVIRESWPE
jgi:hypothetical protein